jgi:hypothetical protein
VAAAHGLILRGVRLSAGRAALQRHPGAWYFAPGLFLIGLGLGVMVSGLADATRSYGIAMIVLAFIGLIEVFSATLNPAFPA